jgi:hypothetical protein
MKSPTTVYFNTWLSLMEDAWRVLSRADFRELEERIKKEIAFHRKRKKG